jgi:hypothetical protein
MMSAADCAPQSSTDRVATGYRHDESVDDDTQGDPILTE